MKISTVQQIRELDKRAIQNYCIPDEVLMENAGLAAISVLKSEIDLHRNNNILIFCGSGNNGGDGFVVTRQLSSLGCNVSVILMAEPDRYQGAAQKNYQIVSHLELSCEYVADIDVIRSRLVEADLVVDAIFGTGLTRDVEGHYASVIQAINQSGLPVLSLDIPSGVNGDTGQIMGTAIQAKWTVTFGLPKLGNLLYPGFEKNGKLYVSHISFPRENVTTSDIQCEVNEPPQLPNRRQDGHKGTFGEGLFIAGAENYYGAPYFSALAFLKAGGGYARLATPRSMTPFLANKGSEIVFHPQTETPNGCLSLDAEDALLNLADTVDFVVIGPGISTNDETQRLALQLIEKIDRPILIDGDGISALQNNLSILKCRKSATILTPHLGEMSRLIGNSIREILNDAVGTARQFSRNHGVYLVLKGAHSLIAAPDGNISINMTGNSGMATAGSGDVLAGTIAAMYGLGLNPGDSARKGVFIHGLAGDLAAEVIGPDGMTAQDILNYLPAALKKDREGDVMTDCPWYHGAIQV